MGEHAIKLRFPGTRGEIDIKNRFHRRHSCLLVEERVLVDCGADWLGRFGSPEAILLTHAHPDHIGGLKRGANCPVYATEETWTRMKRYPIHDRQMVAPFQPFSLCGIRFEAFPVVHSLVAPAVGYRIKTGAVSAFYVPDVAQIRDRHEVMPGLSLYIGDGASIIRPLLRRRGETMIGHTSIRDQLEWCREYAIKQAIITHCGSQIVRDGRSAIRRIQTFAKERDLEVFVAHDGMQVAVTKSGIRFLD